MRVYELVQDHKSGKSKVVSYEERPDPFSRPAIRRLGEDQRARIASLKAWWVALAFAWRDDATRRRITGHALFFLALCVIPVTAAIFTLLGEVSSFRPRSWDTVFGVAVGLCAIAAVGALWLRFGPGRRNNDEI